MRFSRTNRTGCFATRFGLWIGSLLLLSACQNAGINGAPLPEELWATRFCVERQPRDRRDLGVEIAESLRGAGIDAYSSDVGKCRDESGYRVTYVDNWAWDMRTYLSKMLIEVTDLSTDEIVAYGESHQDSFAGLGLSFRDVIDRAVSAMFPENVENEGAH